MRTTFFTAMMLAATPALAAIPTVDAISSSSVPQGGWIEITGSGFGLPPGRQTGARVEIGGVSAATARWEDERITAYASEGIAVGDTTLRVISDDGQSNDIAITIEAPAPAADDLAWVFVGDGSQVTHRPTVGPDGTVYASDARGYLYAIAPSGIVRWIRHGPTVGGTGDYWVGDGDKGPIAVGADGTVYVAIDLLGPEWHLQAYAADGTLRWIHREELGEPSHGPTVGPDGDIYLGVSGPGGGIRILESDGSIRFTSSEPYLQGTRPGTYGVEIEFSPDGDRFYVASATPVADVQLSRGSLHALSLDGSTEWSSDGGSHQNLDGQRQGQPAVGQDGTIFLTASFVGQSYGVHGYSPDGERQWSHVPSPSNVITEPAAGGAGVYVISNTIDLLAVDPDGTRLWSRDLQGRFLQAPTVDPAGEIVVAAGAFDEGAAMVAVEAYEGALRWRVELPERFDLGVRPSARVRFTEDGGRAYVAATLGINDGRWALYAVDTPAPEETGAGGAGGAGGSETGAGGAGGSETGAGGAGGSETGAGGSGGGTGGTGCATAGGGTSPLLATMLALAALAIRVRP